MLLKHLGALLLGCVFCVFIVYIYTLHFKCTTFKNVRFLVELNWRKYVKGFGVHAVLFSELFLGDGFIITLFNLLIGG